MIIYKFSMAERKLGYDFDDCIVDKTTHLRKTLTDKYSWKFKDRHFEGAEPPDSLLEPEYAQAWWDYVDNPQYIGQLKLCPEVLKSFPVIANFFGETWIWTARGSHLLPELNRFIKDYGLAPHISGFIVRTPEVKDILKYKVASAVVNGFNYAVEDTAQVAFCLGEVGIDVALMDTPRNRILSESAHIRRYNNSMEFANDLIEHGNPENLFAFHRNQIRERIKMEAAQNVRIFQSVRLPIGEESTQSVSSN